MVAQQAGGSRAGAAQPPVHGLADQIEGRRKPPQICDNKEQAPIQTAPPMANGISSHHIDIDGEKSPLVKTQARLHAIVAPMSAARGARKNIGKTGTINPSTAPVIADTGKVRTATTI